MSSQDCDSTRTFHHLCMPRTIAITLALLTAIPALSVRAQTKVLRFKAVVVGDGSVVQPAVVFIEGDKIVRVMPWRSANMSTQAGADMIDLQDYTAIPGL